MTYILCEEELTNEDVRLNIPEDQQNQEVTSFTRPPHKIATLFALLFMFASLLANDISVSIIHDRVPEQSPLPDLAFSLFPEIGGAIRGVEVVLLVNIVAGLWVIVMHDHKWLVTRRVSFIISVCYSLRAVCISVLQVPVPSIHTYCAPKHNGPMSLSLVLQRTFGILSGLGMDLYRSRKLCGDLIVSGHTILLVLTHLVFKHYSSGRITKCHRLSNMATYVALVLIVLSRKHYTLDVLLGYYLASTVFHIYHSAIHVGATHKAGVRNILWTRATSLIELVAQPAGANKSCSCGR